MVCESAKGLWNRICSMDHPLAALLIAGLLIRFILAPILTFNIDIAYWAEVIDVFQNDFGLYGTAGYYYTPIWGYYLGTVSAIGQLFGITDIGTYITELAPFVNDPDFKISAFITSIQFNVLVKTPLILVDTAVSLILYEFVMKLTSDRKKALLAFALFFFSSLVITESSVHGMFDNMSVMMILISVILAYDRHYFFAGCAFSAAVLTKFFPIFFIFFLVALVIKREGTDKNGIACLSKAIIGAIITFILIYIPNIIRGDFWQSFYFLAYRLGITRQTLAGITPTMTAVIVIALLAVIIVLLYCIYRFWPNIASKIGSIEKKERDRKISKRLFTIAGIVILIVAIICIIKVDPNDIIGSLSMKVVLLISIFSIFVEIYLAYRLLFSDGSDRTIITILMLTGLAVILWPCAPSYSLILVPFVILYATIVDSRFVKPYLLFTILMTLMEITAYMTSLTSLSVYTGWIDFAVVKGVFEFLTSSILGLNTAWLFTIIFGTIAYLSMLAISYKWYSEHIKGAKE